MLKNIILDMGNVLLDFDSQVSLDAFCRTEEEKAVIRRELFDAPEWEMGDRGDIPDAARFDLVKRRVPEAMWPALRSCCDHWDVCMEPLPGAREFCRYVKGAGYGVYVLSNASDLFYRYFPPFLPLEFFDGVVVSSDLRLLKPQPEIYRYLLEKYKLSPGECLFIDDRAENVRGAEDVGMNAIRFDGDFERIKRLYSL